MQKKLILSVAVCMGVSVLLWAHDDSTMANQTHSKEFERIKQLSGTWKGTSVDHDGKTSPITVDYHVTSAGSAVEERLMAGTPREMVDMYDEEGGKLVMTHYCAMGNHPHLLLKNADAKQIVLEMGPTPDIDAAKDEHMHALTLEWTDPNHLVQRWYRYKNGKPDNQVVFTLTRSAS
jgi:hypothetical protein